MLLPCRFKTRISTASSATSMRPSAWEYPTPGWVNFQSATLGQFCIGGNNVLRGREKENVYGAIGLLADEIARQSGRGPRPAPWYDAAFKQIDDLLSHDCIDVHFHNLRLRC